jgi:hypothetical protein
MKILLVLTSHDKLGDTGRKTGFWLEEFGRALREGRGLGKLRHHRLNAYNWPEPGILQSGGRGAA